MRRSLALLALVAACSLPPEAAVPRPDALATDGAAPDRPPAPQKADVLL